MYKGALTSVALEGFLRGEVGEAELIDVDEIYVSIFRWVRTKIPRLDLVQAHLDLVDVPNEMQLCVILHHRAPRPEFLDLLFWIRERRDFLLCFRQAVGIGHLDVGTCACGSLAAVLRQGRAGRSGGFRVIVAVLLATGF